MSLESSEAGVLGVVMHQPAWMPGAKLGPSTRAVDVFKLRQLSSFLFLIIIEMRYQAGLQSETLSQSKNRKRRWAQRNDLPSLAVRDRSSV